MLVNLAMNGVETEFVTRLPENLISECAVVATAEKVRRRA